MAQHLDLGRQGEDLARIYLVKNGFEILHQNWRHAHAELDFIASKEGILHIIEVKTRSNERFGYPEESVDRKKMDQLTDAAEAFQFEFPQWQSIQFDILSINLEADKSFSFFFIEDVYY